MLVRMATSNYVIVNLRSKVTLKKASDWVTSLLIWRSNTNGVC